MYKQKSASSYPGYVDIKSFVKITAVKIYRNEI